MLGVIISLFPKSWQSMYKCQKHLPYIWAYFLYEYMYGFSSYKPLQNQSINLCWAQMCGELFQPIKKNLSQPKIRSTLESGINVHLRLLIFGIFFQGLQSYYRLKRLKFYYISLHILRGYVYSFCQNFQRLYLFKGHVYSGL